MMIYFTAYLLSCVGGWLVAGLSVWLMRKSVGSERKFFQWIDIWVGFTERAITTTLFIWTPNLVAPFIGGWIALKIAAGWQRLAGPEHKRPHLIALVGSALSFAMAIAGGLLVAPESVTVISGAQ